MSPRPAHVPRFPAAAPCLAVAAALLTGPASAPAHAAHAAPVSAPLPDCTAPEDHTFPLTTRLRGGPGGYEAGGAPGTWYLDLTNTTDRTCSDLHPVIVLAGERRAPEPGRLTLEFYAGQRAHPVRFAPAGAGELAGVLATEDTGFTVAAGRTLTVRLRLTAAPGAAPGRITAHAAVVPRREGDGGDAWLGRSNDYRFRITSGGPAATLTGGPATPTGGPATPTAATATPTAAPAIPASSPPPSTPPGRLPFADELAGTGLARTPAAVALMAAALLAAAGTTTVLLARRRR
ncbi:hypothetical protein GCM10010259_27290 [Streptomyces daghestanicus]|uniref:Gram-positive cocci surface proteins LPxTG domain-containing protein n=1 Tax=Streptomyces daghestanicus TaxID=66885 RepID=A0ABQ3Q9Q4_9ACTN|nr:hypothetical protein GCM10010259_27290 [Streptomyces daghestanicus]GHI33996.1 hypothetical protein Sdagh_57260 [Streptomyces daghestanicus]